MSTAIEPVIPTNRWEEQKIRLTQFSGGSTRGAMIQISKKNVTDIEVGYIQLTRDEAIRVAHRMIEWALNVAVMGDDLED